MLRADTKQERALEFVSAGCDDDQRSRRRERSRVTLGGNAEPCDPHPADTKIVETRRARRTIAWIGSTMMLASLTSLFAFAHWQYWRRTGDPKGIAVAIQELVVVFVALARRRPSAVSSRPSEWCVALVATYGVLLLRPGGNALWGLEPLWSAVQVVGATAAIVCLLGLGRSFGLVPANRGIKRSGAYRFVRHPVYAAYVVTMTAYVAAAPTLTNIAVYAIAIGFQVRRIFAEEALLSDDEEYAAYSTDVRWRLLPGVF